MLPLAIPITNNIVSDISFLELKILLTEEINKGGMPEKPRPTIPTPMKLTACTVGKIAKTNPVRLITDNIISKVPALNLYDKTVIMSLPASIPIQNNVTIKLASQMLNNLSNLKKVGAHEKMVTSDIT